MSKAAKFGKDINESMTCFFFTHNAKTHVYQQILIQIKTISKQRRNLHR